MRLPNEIVVKRMTPLVKARCHHCKALQVIAIKRTFDNCKNCGKKDYLELESNEPLDSYAALVLRRLQQHDDVILSSSEKNKYDVDFISNTFSKANIGIQSQPGATDVREYNKKECRHCGVCNTCVECICGEHYTRNLNECPKCKKGLNHSIQSYFKEAIIKGESRKACPY